VCLNYLIRIMIAALLFLLDYEKIEMMMMMMMMMMIVMVQAIKTT
jgi:hypothetical protein